MTGLFADINSIKVVDKYEQNYNFRAFSNLKKNHFYVY